jgi:hypothetical protein
MKNIKKGYLLYILIAGIVIIGLVALYYWNMQNTIDQIMG